MDREAAAKEQLQLTDGQVCSLHTCPWVVEGAPLVGIMELPLASIVEPLQGW